MYLPANKPINALPTTNNVKFLVVLDIPISIAAITDKTLIAIKPRSLKKKQNNVELLYENGKVCLSNQVTKTLIFVALLLFSVLFIKYYIFNSFIGLEAKGK